MWISWRLGTKCECIYIYMYTASNQKVSYVSTWVTMYLLGTPRITHRIQPIQLSFAIIIPQARMSHQWTPTSMIFNCREASDIEDLYVSSIICFSVCFTFSENPNPYINTTKLVLPHRFLSYMWWTQPTLYRQRTYKEVIPDPRNHLMHPSVIDDAACIPVITGPVNLSKTT